MEISDTEYFEFLDRAITGPASQVASEKNLMAQILRAHGVRFEPQEANPDRLYHELVSEPYHRVEKTIAKHFVVLAYPGEAPHSPPQVAKILLQVALGHPGLAHFAVITDSTLWPDEEVSKAPVGAERLQPGYYALVNEAGAFLHPHLPPFARRILDAEGKRPRGQLLLRLNPVRIDSSPTLPVPRCRGTSRFWGALAKRCFSAPRGRDA